MKSVIIMRWTFQIIRIPLTLFPPSQIKNCDELTSSINPRKDGVFRQAHPVQPFGGWERRLEDREGEGVKGLTALHVTTAQISKRIEFR